MRKERWYWLPAFCLVSLLIHLGMVYESRSFTLPAPPIHGAEIRNHAGRYARAEAFCRACGEKAGRQAEAPFQTRRDARARSPRVNQNRPRRRR